MPNEALNLNVNVRVEHRSVTGELLAVHERHNLVVNTGLNLVRDLLCGTAATPGITSVGIGSSDTAVDAAQTALVAEISTAGTSQRSVDDGVLTIQRYIGTSEANGNTLKEAGLFAGDVMFARVIFDGIVKTTAATVTITWAVTIGAGA